MRRTPLAALTAMAVTAAGVWAQTPDGSYWLRNLEWRSIGPARGGRVCAVSGVRGDPLTHYMGACGGGVWKTEDAGVSWRNISDGFLRTGSVGAMAVSESDPNVIYVGMGEPCVRGNFSHGDGVYRSLDAGRTWTHCGLTDTRQIGRIVVHPADHDVVYVAALGHVFGPNAERGVFRSRDGGATWDRVLHIDDRTGAVDLSMDPHNPRVLYAGFWQVQRTPWSLESGGNGGLYRSRDGGDTWQRLGGGLPEGVVGRVGVTASGAQRDRVWAIVEAAEGGVFRSDDGGDSWSRVNSDRELRQRAWYYTHIQADPDDAGTVYVLNVQFHKSIDGGRTFSTIRVPHGDNHGLWIDPDDAGHMINGNDGGAAVSFNAGRTWSRQDNQPTAQFYHVTTDNHFPYRVLGAQQDNSTACISSRRITWREEFHSVGGGESGWIAPRPDDPDVVYAGSYGGLLTRYDHRLRKTRNITVWPDDPIGAGAAGLVHRFQWTFPIVLSPHDPGTLYVAGEVLFVSNDEGHTWRVISPDLTTNDKARQGPSGGPITGDNTSVEYYCTIFALAESPLRRGLIWAGSDDGLVHVTADGGATWDNVTPRGMGDWPLISLIEASPHDENVAWLAVNRYKMDDFRPSVYRTDDRGKSWTRLGDSIDQGAFVRAVREDPVRPGLVYAGTETGVWVSFDRGAQWQRLQLNLPVVPITDLVVRGDELVVSTQGRSFWILEGLSLLRQIDPSLDRTHARLFAPAPAYRQRWDDARLHLNLPERLPEEARIEVIDQGGAIVRGYALRMGESDRARGEGDEDAPRSRGGSDDTIAVQPGMNLLRWDLRAQGPRHLPGAVTWNGPPPGPVVVPGEYPVRLRLGEAVQEVLLEIRGDPRVATTSAEYQEQFAMLRAIAHSVDEAHAAVLRVRSIRGQVEAAVERARRARLDEGVTPAAREILAELSRIEGEIVQTRAQASQDALNFPIKLNDKLAGLFGVVEGDYPVTAQARAVYEHLLGQLQAEFGALRTLVDERVPAFNRLIAERGVPAIVIDDEASGG
jgi:photosystem II stability/assembly factor-like uncharacterized protein